jgi:hypothetical protein
MKVRASLLVILIFWLAICNLASARQPAVEISGIPKYDSLWEGKSAYRTPLLPVSPADSVHNYDVLNYILDVTFPFCTESRFYRDDSRFLQSQLQFSHLQQTGK